MSHIFSIILIFLGPSLWAANCDESLSSPITPAEVRPLSFNGVEVYRRNNNMAPQQYGDLQFKEWMVLEEDESILSVLGLNREGRLFHLVQFKKEDRRIARILNGTRNFTRFYLSDGKYLAGESKDGSVHFFSPSKWMKKPGPAIVLNGAKIWTASTTGLVAAASYFWQIPLENLPMTAASIGGMNAFHTGFVMLQMFENQNTFPDGFEAVAHREDQIGLSEQSLREFELGAHFKPPPFESIAPLIPEPAREDIR